MNDARPRGRTMERPLTGFFSFLPDAVFLPPLPLEAFLGEPSLAGLGERLRFPSSDMLDVNPFDVIESKLRKNIFGAQTPTPFFIWAPRA